MKTRAMLFLSVMGLTACGDSGAPDISGTWRTDCLAQTNQGMTSYAVYEISDATGTPRFTVTSYADPACTTKLFAIGNESRREVGAEIPEVPGAYALDIHYEKLFAVAYSDMTAGFLASAGCGEGAFTVGEEKDTSTTGCLFFQPISACPMDNDIVKVEGDSLYNGVRDPNADMCVAAGRPKALNTFAFRRVEP